MTASQTRFQFDGSAGTAEPHAPELYNPVQTASALPGLTAIDDDARAFYREHGYLAVAGVYGPEQVADAIGAIDDLITGRNAGFNGIYFEAAAKEGIEQTEARERLDRVRKLAGFVAYDERLNRLAHDPKLLAAVAGLLGGHEPQLYQDMALLKPPRIGREKPWHQDHAYFRLALDEPVVGVWIALDRATVENGCMQLLDRGHHAGPMYHWKRRDWQICDSDMLGKGSVACPLDPGGGLFFDSLLPHGTPTNHSPDRRRALQFHYCRAGAAVIEKEQRLAVFGTDGKDVTC